jgi:hypothetical protein
MKNNKNKNKQVKIKRDNKKFRRKVKRNRNFRRFKRKLSHDLFVNKINTIRENQADVRLYADEDFELLVNTKEVIDYISVLKSYRKVNHLVKTVFIDLSKVINIDIGSVSLLLSSIKELNIYEVNIKGNLPINEKAKQFIIKSGYLEHMSNLSKKLRKDIRTFTSDNLILMSGASKSESRKIGECIKKSIGILSGISHHYPPVYGMIQEMNGNSVEHAYRKKKHWLLGVNIDTINNKIIFTYTDNGYGILNTMKRKFSAKINDFFKGKNDIEVLNGLFDREYNSRFKEQYNRNKGLPVIKKAVVNDKVKNLLVITNGVYLHFNNNSSLQLNSPFKGTFYYWELDLETIKNGRIKN